MTVNTKSLQGRLVNLARGHNTDVQLLLNRLGAEQFLWRLRQSPYAEQLIFKGGLLLAYLIESERKTKDLDFSVTHPALEGQQLDHPDMESPGVRIMCRFLLGKMRGYLRMDLAKGDIVTPIEQPLKRLRYRNEPLMGEDFSLFAYPLETIFAEKFQITVKKGAQNTRMKDYYDLLKLTEQDLDHTTLRQTLQATFANRNTAFVRRIHFDDESIVRLQTYWDHFVKRDNPPHAPQNISEVIAAVNAYLSTLYDS